MKSRHSLLHRILRATKPGLTPGMLATAFALASAGALHAGTFAFEATTTGSWTADDSGAPSVTLHIEHPSVTAPGFSFSGLVADEVVNTADIPFLVAGTLLLTAIDGDTLSAQYSGTVLPSGNPGEFLGSTLFEFTGGTGQFAGASGGGTLDAVVQFTGPLDGISTWELSGTVTTVPEPQFGGLAAGSVLVALGLRRRRSSHGRSPQVSTASTVNPENNR